MELHLRIVGALLILLASMHVAFPRYFAWRDELANLTLLTRQLIYVHTFFIGFVVLLMGVLCCLETKALLGTALGRDVLLGLFLFWYLRLIFQLFVYSPALWRGKRFETGVHVIFTLMWTYVSGVFLISIAT
jgi:hypothetical protein